MTSTRYAERTLTRAGYACTWTTPQRLEARHGAAIVCVLNDHGYVGGITVRLARAQVPDEDDCAYVCCAPNLAAAMRIAERAQNW